jgi:hypothetical protein
MFTIECCCCNKALNYPEDQVGKRVRCPHCRKALLLPDLDGDPSLPQDLIFLLTPVDDLSRRIEGPEFTAFMLQLDKTISDELHQQNGAESLVFQVACALLPNRTKIIDIQMQPPNAASVLITHLRSAIDKMPMPEVSNGPVAFMRQVVFGDAKLPQGGFTPSFLRFLLGPGPAWLDDVLMQTAGIPSRSRSLWRKLVGFFYGEAGPVRTMAGHDAIRDLGGKLDLPVIPPRGRVCLGSSGAPRPP